LVEIQEYLKLWERPDGLPAMYQKWRDLTFLHFTADPAEIQKLIPDELTVDTFPDASGQERAWIGLVPFWMTGIRLCGAPAVPGLSMFPETNVRTYVHRKGKEPGVWFFSLDASNRIACAWARRFFGLPYHWARMQVTSHEDERHYASARFQNQQASCDVSIQVGNALGLQKPGNLEFFLIERYLLYAMRLDGLYSGVVNHRPYQLHGAELLDCKEGLTTASQIPGGPWEHCIYSPGVDVEVFGIQKVNS
jgi:uncharacterized protein YqjF (DUF2071 family)